MYDKHTVVSENRLHIIRHFAAACSHLEGDVIELGVYKGGVSLMLAHMLPHKTIHAYDTFTGIPNAVDGVDLHKNGDFNDVGGVPKILTDRFNVRVHQGLFPRTLVSDRYCFAHFDGDTYQSCCDFLKYVRPTVLRGGVMIFDDYKWHMCPGVEKALLESFPADKLVEFTNGQCVVFIE